MHEKQEITIYLFIYFLNKHLNSNVCIHLKENKILIVIKKIF